MSTSSFKQEDDFEKRHTKAARISEKYPDKIPIRFFSCWSCTNIQSIYCSDEATMKVSSIAEVESGINEEITIDNTKVAFGIALEV
uniref:Uncharacterized protein n=1 Tax=Cucumis melo TaxID=3656 RepID=A0A9I9E5H4_CUCME